MLINIFSLIDNIINWFSTIIINLIYSFTNKSSHKSKLSNKLPKKSSRKSSKKLSRKLSKKSSKTSSVKSIKKDKHSSTISSSISTSECEDLVKKLFETKLLTNTKNIKSAKYADTFVGGKYYWLSDYLTNYNLNATITSNNFKSLKSGTLLSLEFQKLNYIYSIQFTANDFYNKYIKNSVILSHDILEYYFHQDIITTNTTFYQIILNSELNGKIIEPELYDYVNKYILTIKQIMDQISLLVLLKYNQPFYFEVSYNEPNVNGKFVKKSGIVGITKYNASIDYYILFGYGFNVY
jgi:hypothetical protein